MLLWSGMAPPGIAQVLSVDPAPSLERAVQDGFGQAVAVSGDLALVGEGGSLVTEGVVLVYRRDAAGAWTEVQQLTAPDAGRGDGFGQAVALDGDVAVIGAPTRDDGAGKAYVFEVDADSDQFVAVATLQAEQAAPGDGFGSAVAVSGGAVLVGAPQARGTGAAYAFRRTADGSWTAEGRLHQNGLADGDFFGWSVALDGDWAFVGAQFRQGTGTVEVFRYDGQDTWIADDTLVGSTAEDGARFGFAVALDGDVAVVGAPTQASF
ncbi:MAG: hypothetical protein GVY18_02130, partial [Bacteroidetes bacterium]|nr:hypothetical protein [Bacteroidota bacterium]